MKLEIVGLEKDSTANRKDLILGLLHHLFEPKSLENPGIGNAREFLWGEWLVQSR